MEQTLFDIYLTGRLAAGVTPGDAAQRLAQLFRTGADTTANLITGKPALIKRGVDQATGQKYRDALQRAGLEVEIRPQNQPATSDPGPASTDQGLTLAPAGADLLTASERKPDIANTVDTSHLKLTPQRFEPLGPADSGTRAPRTEIDAPDFSLAPVGGDLLQPDEKSHAPSMTPPVPDLTLAEAGATLETLASHEAPLNPDISGLSLAPAEGDLLKAGETPAKPTPPPPDISHLRLSE